MDCGAIPENATGPLRKFCPDYVLLVDAADLGEKAGTIQFVELDQVRGFSASSHSLPLSVLARFMMEEFHCDVGLCCIQPKRLDFEQPVSVEVDEAITVLSNEILNILD